MKSPESKSESKTPFRRGRPEAIVTSPSKISTKERSSPSNAARSPSGPLHSPTHSSRPSPISGRSMSMNKPRPLNLRAVQATNERNSQADELLRQKRDRQRERALQHQSLPRKFPSSLEYQMQLAASVPPAGASSPSASLSPSPSSPLSPSQSSHSAQDALNAQLGLNSNNTISGASIESSSPGVTVEM